MPLRTHAIKATGNLRGCRRPEIIFLYQKNMRIQSRPIHSMRPSRMAQSPFVTGHAVRGIIKRHPP